VQIRIYRAKDPAAASATAFRSNGPAAVDFSQNLVGTSGMSRRMEGGLRGKPARVSGAERGFPAGGRL